MSCETFGVLNLIIGLIMGLVIGLFFYRVGKAKKSL